MGKFTKKPLPKILGLAENHTSLLAKPVASARSARMDNLISAINRSPELELDNVLARVKEAMVKGKSTS